MNIQTFLRVLINKYYYNTQALQTKQSMPTIHPIHPSAKVIQMHKRNLAIVQK